MYRKFNSSFITDIEMKYVGLLIFVLLIQIFTAYSVELAQDDESSKLKDSEIPILVDEDIGIRNIQNENEPYQNDDDGGQPRVNSGKESKHVNGKPNAGISDAHCVLTGSLSNIVGNLLASLSSLHTALSELTDCVSITISSVSKTLFTIVDPLADITGSTFDIITSLSGALPKAFSTIIIILSDLNLGEVSTSIHTAIDDLQESLNEIVNIVDDDGKLKDDIAEKVDETITSVAASVQILVNTVSFVIETTSQTIGFIKIDMQDGVASLTLVLDTVLIIVQIIIASFTCMLSSSQQSISSTLNKFLVTMDDMTQGISGIVTSVASNLLVDVSLINETLKMLTTNLNTSLIDVLGVFKGFTISFEHLTDNLTSKASSTATGITDGLEKLLNELTDALGHIGTSLTASVQSIKSSLDIVSSSDTGALSSMTSELISTFDLLSKLTGSAEVIVPEFISSLKIIFEEISSSSTTTSLVRGLGMDIATSVIKYVIEIAVSVSHLLTLINGVSKLDYSGVEGHVKDIAKNAQILISTVAAITASVSQSIDELDYIVFEVVLALQYCLATILFILQWTLTLAASVSLQFMSGKVSEALSSITVSVSGALHNISKITATVSGALPENIASIVSLIAVPVSEFGSTVTSTFSVVSGIVYNVTANIRQLSSSIGSNAKGSDGSVAQILEGLAGGLGSVSSTLSSSVSDLTSSFKQIGNSTYATIKSATDKLSLVIETITAITDSSSEILSSVSDSLSGILSQILESVSTLTDFGEVRGSVTSSVSNIVDAINSLSDVINVDSENLNDVSEIVDKTKNIAKTIQILISTFSAVVNALVDSSKTIANPLSEAVLTLSYIVSTVILVVQEVLGAAIASMSVIFGKISVSLQQLTVSNSVILEKATSISSSITSSLTGTVPSLTLIVRNMSSSVTDLNTLCTSSLSVISGVTVNINVSLGQMASESLPKLPSVDLPLNEETVDNPAVETSEESGTITIEPVDKESVEKTDSKVSNDQVSEANSRETEPKEVRDEL